MNIENIQPKSIFIFSRVDFEYMMSHLPVYVSIEEINEMFAFADKDKDGKISYHEFLVSVYVIWDNLETFKCILLKAGAR